MELVDGVEFDPATDAFNPAAPEVIRDPYPWYAVLRERAPVHVGVQEMRFLTRYADVDRTLRDHVMFVRGSFSQTLRRSWGDNSLSEVMSGFMFALDPPDHTRLRGLVAGSFTRRRMERLRPRMRELAIGLLDQALANGRSTIDVIKEFAYPLPLQIVCEILGVPAEDRELLRSWTCDVTPTVDVAISQQVKARGIEAAAAFKGYFMALISQRRRQPQDDLLSELLEARDRGDHLSERELITLSITLLIAGHENVTNLIGNGVLALATHPNEMELLLRTPAHCADVVTETLRYDSPVTYVPREARGDTQFNGVPVKAGQTVVAMLGAANRDPRRFVHPDRFMLNGRPRRAQIDFGRGVAYCLGAPLATIEAEVAFSALAERLGRFELAIADRELQWRPTIWARGVTSLPIACGAPITTS